MVEIFNSQKMFISLISNIYLKKTCMAWQIICDTAWLLMVKMKMADETCTPGKIPNNFMLGAY